MTKAKKDEEINEDAVKEADAHVEETADEGDVATVYSGNGNVVRTYTKEIHGKDFKKLAKQFADGSGFTWK